MENCLKEGTKVLVHSLGDEYQREFRGIIRGIGWVVLPEKLGGIGYIIEMIDKIPGQGSYSNICITSACVKIDDKEKQ